MKRILIIYNEDFPWDIRIDKFCKTLTNNKYDVHLLCNNKQNRCLNEEYEKTNIHRLPRLRPDFLKTAIFCNPIWLYKGYVISKEKKIEAIMIRDLPLALTGIVIGKILNVPIIYDMAENYPEAVRVWKKTGEYQGFIDKVLRSYPIFKLIEKIACRFCDLIFVVVEENRVRLEKMGIPSQKIVIIENTPSLDGLKMQGLPTNVDVDDHDRDFIILYIGGLQFHRGLFEVITGMRHVIQRVPNARLVIVGDGPQRSVYEKRVTALNLMEHVSFEGYVNFPKIFEYVYLSQVCLVPHRRSNHTDTTMPNKIYDYMALGKPVLVSDATPLRRLVTGEKCGVTFRSGNSNDFAERVCELYADSDKREDMGLNGQNAVLKKYNWKVYERMLIESIDGLL